VLLLKHCKIIRLFKETFKQSNDLKFIIIIISNNIIINENYMYKEFKLNIIINFLSYT